MFLALRGTVIPVNYFLNQHDNSTVDSVSTINPTVIGVIKANSNLI